jgi:hypothetical protein
MLSKPKQPLTTVSISTELRDALKAANPDLSPSSIVSELSGMYLEGKIAIRPRSLMVSPNDPPVKEVNDGK